MNMKKKKSVLGLILSLALLFGLIPAQKMDVEAGNPFMVDEIVLSIKEPKAGALITKEFTNAEPDKYSVSVWWKDCTNNYSNPNEGDIFLEGHTYQFGVEITMADGYTLAPDAKVYLNNVQMRFGGTISNTHTFVEDFEIPSRTEQPVKTEDSFTTLKDKTIYDVGISNIQEPRAGKYTSKTCICDGELYQVESEIWTRGLGHDITGYFIPGVTYEHHITLKAKEGYTFAPTEVIHFTVNGQHPNLYYVSNDYTQLFYEEHYVIEEPVAGTWMSDSRGWWYQYPDGSYENDGFLKIGDRVFYFEKNGYIHTGWLYEDGDWFYFDGSGYMAEEWQYIDGNWYYFYAPEGTMLKDTETPDGYYVNESGVWIPDQWVYDESVGKYWYHYSY